MPLFPISQLSAKNQKYFFDLLSLRDIACLGLVSEDYKIAIMKNAGRDRESCAWYFLEDNTWRIELDYNGIMDSVDNTEIDGSQVRIQESDMVFAKHFFDMFRIRTCGLRIPAMRGIRDCFIFDAWYPNTFGVIELFAPETNHLLQEDLSNLLEDLKTLTLITNGIQERIKIRQRIIGIRNLYIHDTLWLDTSYLKLSDFREMTVQNIQPIRRGDYPDLQNVTAIIVSWFFHRGSAKLQLFTCPLALSNPGDYDFVQKRIRELFRRFTIISFITETGELDNGLPEYHEKLIIRSDRKRGKVELRVRENEFCFSTSEGNTPEPYRIYDLDDRYGRALDEVNIRYFQFPVARPFPEFLNRILTKEEIRHLCYFGLMDWGNRDFVRLHSSLNNLRCTWTYVRKMFWVFYLDERSRENRWNQSLQIMYNDPRLQPGGLLRLISRVHNMLNIQEQVLRIPANRGIHNYLMKYSYLPTFHIVDVGTSTTMTNSWSAEDLHYILETLRPIELRTSLMHTDIYYDRTVKIDILRINYTCWLSLKGLMRLRVKQISISMCFDDLFNPDTFSKLIRRWYRGGLNRLERFQWQHRYAEPYNPFEHMNIPRKVRNYPPLPSFIPAMERHHIIRRPSDKKYAFIGLRENPPYFWFCPWFDPAREIPAELASDEEDELEVKLDEEDALREELGEEDQFEYDLDDESDSDSESDSEDASDEEDESEDDSDEQDESGGDDNDLNEERDAENEIDEEEPLEDGLAADNDVVPIPTAPNAVEKDPIDDVAEEPSRATKKRNHPNDDEDGSNLVKRQQIP